MAASEGGDESVEIFVTGRICLFGEHSDWAGGYRRFNSEVVPGCALVCGTDQGLYARARKTSGNTRVLRYTSSDDQSIELDLDDTTNLRQVAQSSSIFAYIAGCVLELGKHFRVGGAEIVNYKSDLPIKKGLSSSAAICVLIVRSLNMLYDLKLTVHGEMDIAYRGEIQTPSRCGRMDQCVAFGRAVTKMTFDSDLLSTESVRAAYNIYMVVVDLCSKKDTKEILKCLNEAYPFPRRDVDKALHSLLGEINQEMCQEAQEILGDRDERKAAERLGQAMCKAQARWDEIAVPLCPHELKAPSLHRLLEFPALQRHITGGKGVGSQGDGSAQLVCKSEADQEEVMKIVKSMAMEPLKLTIPKQKAVRTAIVPVAGGACSGMWPATKCVGPWLFPVRKHRMVKPAIAWLCEELVDAGIERILLVVNHTTEVEMTKLFKQREEVSILDGVGQHAEGYDEVLLAIGEKITFVRQEKPSGISDALVLCEQEVDGEAFLLAWGDHFCRSTSPENLSCVGQLLRAFTGRSVVGMHCVDKDGLHGTSVYACKEPPTPLPPPLGPRDVTAAAPALWPLSRLAEKPTREFADEHLVTPQLPAGNYLASFGHYILTFSTFRALRANKGGHFTHILDELRLSEGVDGVLIEGERWDLGNMQTYIQCLQAQAQDDQAPSKRSGSR